MEDYDVTVTAVAGRQEIPFPYVLDPRPCVEPRRGVGARTGALVPGDRARAYRRRDRRRRCRRPTKRGRWRCSTGCAPISASRGLRHYTGTPPEHVQRYVLFTNYHRYVDEFVRWAFDQLGEGSRFTALSGAGGVLLRAGDDIEAAMADTSAWRRHQMPAYHLMADDHTGITLVNIGVGPSNAKTICDHLAVLRPEAWLMIGHCGGLQAQPADRRLCAGPRLSARRPCARRRAAARDPGARDRRSAGGDGAARRSRFRGQSGEELKRRLRTGTIVTTDDRNWELRYTKSALRFSLCRAVGDRHGIGDDRRAGLPLPRALTARCYACRTSRCTASSSCPARPTASTSARSPSICGSASRPARIARRGRQAPQPQAARVQRAAVPLTSFAAAASMARMRSSPALSV